jgi:enoyl-CoA hydratase/carnithine racemase
VSLTRDAVGADVIVERRGAATLLRLNRPHRSNAVGGALFGDLLRAAEAADADQDVRAIVTIGEGRTYCVGADRGVLADVAEGERIDLAALGMTGMGGDVGLPPQSSTQRRADAIGIGRWSTRFLGLGLPTIAALNGGAAGGGLAVALLHDIRIAARTARITPGHAALGLAPEMGLSWILPRLLGTGRAFDLLTRRTPVEADEALTLGLVEQVVEPTELLDAALARAESLAALPPLAVRAAKRLTQRSWEGTLEDQLEREWAAQVQLFADPATVTHLRQAVR